MGETPSIYRTVSVTSLSEAVAAAAQGLVAGPVPDQRHGKHAGDLGSIQALALAELRQSGRNLGRVRGRDRLRGVNNHAASRLTQSGRSASRPCSAPIGTDRAASGDATDFAEPRFVHRHTHIELNTNPACRATSELIARIVAVPSENYILTASMQVVVRVSIDAGISILTRNILPKNTPIRIVIAIAININASFRRLSRQI